jgi:hypothetical protein
MRKHHPQNERIKRDYLTYLEHSGRMSASSVDQIASAISLFEASTSYKDLRKFHRAQAIAFKERLKQHVNAETGRPLAKATIHSRLSTVKASSYGLLAGQDIDLGSPMPMPNISTFLPMTNGLRVQRDCGLRRRLRKLAPR